MGAKRQAARQTRRRAPEQTGADPNAELSTVADRAAFVNRLNDAIIKLRSAGKRYSDALEVGDDAADLVEAEMLAEMADGETSAAAHALPDTVVAWSADLDTLPPIAEENELIASHWIWRQPDDAVESYLAGQSPCPSYPRPDPETVLAALAEHVGMYGTWLALTTLEPPPTTDAPTASLEDRIARAQIACDVLNELMGQNSGGRPKLVAVRRGALRIAWNACSTYRESLEKLHAARARKAAAAAGRNRPQGQRGTMSGAERLRRMLGLLGRASEQVTYRQLAELILESGRWAMPPCRRYVANLLDDARDDWDRAVDILRERLKKASQRS